MRISFRRVTAIALVCQIISMVIALTSHGLGYALQTKMLDPDFVPASLAILGLFDMVIARPSLLLFFIVLYKNQK